MDRPGTPLARLVAYAKHEPTETEPNRAARLDQGIRRLSVLEALHALHEAALRMGAAEPGEWPDYVPAVDRVTDALLRRAELPLEAPLIDRFIELGTVDEFTFFGEPLVIAVELLAAREGVGAAAGLAWRLRHALSRQRILPREVRRPLVRRLHAILSEEPGPRAGEPWADRARAELALLGEQARGKWAALFALADRTDPPQPTKEWRKSARALVAGIGRKAFASRLAAWLPLVTAPVSTTPATYAASPAVPPMSDDNEDALTVLVWAAGDTGDPAFATLAGDLALVCFTKIGRADVLSTKVGAACIWALGELEGQSGIAQLRMLEKRVKHAASKRLVAAALGAPTPRKGRRT